MPSPMMGNSYPEGSSPARQSLGGNSPTNGVLDGCMQKVNAAKSFWKRLKYDDTFPTKGVMVGYKSVDIKARRKSGKDAWSDRQQIEVLEQSFDALCKFWGDSVPYHQIQYFKTNDGSVSWCSTQPKHGKPSAGRLSHTSTDTPYDTTTEGDTFNATDDEAPRAPLELPSECWQLVASHLNTRDTCALSCCSSATQRALHTLHVWNDVHRRLFGRHADSSATVATVKRMCRKSELQANPWFASSFADSSIGFRNTTCIAMDDSKVVSKDGGRLRVWCPSTGNRFGAMPCSMATHHLAFSATHLAAIDHTSVRVWDMDTLKTQLVSSGAGVRSAVCFFGDMLASGDKGGTVEVLDMHAGTGGGSVVMDFNQAGGVSCMASVTPGVLTIAGRAVCVWDMETNMCSAKLYDPLQPPASLETCISEHPPSFEKVAVSTNLVAAATDNGMLALWDLRTACLVDTLPATRHPLWSSSVSTPPTALLLDHYKLILSTTAGICVHDTRAVSGSSGLRHQWSAPVRSFDMREMSTDGEGAGGGRVVSCLAGHGNRMIAGFADEGPCHMWAFGRSEIDSTPLILQDDATGVSPEADEGSSKGKRSKKPKNVPKRQQNRYPKRGQ